ncbi:IS110 family transposase [Parapedobacter sp. SGR-10]|uniref:IS110 family transposase n=1 Tax=Parapedobacter sp. SGR-10 TaxID=2710879 RepID=UPI001F0F366E|nr:IS110 family transposase [Parapedobacter sp. SGR-10]
MEATGVYHESLAYYLCNIKKQVSVVLPNKIGNYARTLDIKTITDKSASQAIARFGLERQLESWQPPFKILNDLRHLCREREQVGTGANNVKKSTPCRTYFCNIK